MFFFLFEYMKPFTSFVNLEFFLTCSSRGNILVFNNGNRFSVRLYILWLTFLLQLSIKLYFFACIIQV